MQRLRTMRVMVIMVVGSVELSPWSWKLLLPLGQLRLRFLYLIWVLKVVLLRIMGLVWWIIRSNYQLPEGISSDHGLGTSVCQDPQFVTYQDPAGAVTSVESKVSLINPFESERKIPNPYPLIGVEMHNTVPLFWVSSVITV
ncbi:hypothetical protein OIU78_026413 [Salix suchowensis]|nr:hypothetical protein OIU78_026413 [Salix suchowensis]